MWVTAVQKGEEEEKAAFVHMRVEKEKYVKEEEQW